MLERGRYNPWLAYLTMNFKNPFSGRRILSKAFNSHIVCYIVINNFMSLWLYKFLSFVISGGFYHLSQNTLRLINKFQKCWTFKECLIADFLALLPNFLFLQCRLGLGYVYTQSWFFPNIFSFPKSLSRSANREATRTFSLWW